MSNIAVMCEEAYEMCEEILDSWPECDFANDIYEQIEERDWISEKQYNAIVRIYNSL